MSSENEALRERLEDVDVALENELLRATLGGSSGMPSDIDAEGEEDRVRLGADYGSMVAANALLRARVSACERRHLVAGTAAPSPGGDAESGWSSMSRTISETSQDNWQQHLLLTREEHLSAMRKESELGGEADGVAVEKLRDELAARDEQCRHLEAEIGDAKLAAVAAKTKSKRELTKMKAKVVAGARQMELLKAELSELRAAGDVIDDGGGGSVVDQLQAQCNTLLREKLNLEAQRVSMSQREVGQEDGIVQEEKEGAAPKEREDVCQREGTVREESEAGQAEGSILKEREVSQREWSVLKEREVCQREGTVEVGQPSSSGEIVEASRPNRDVEARVQEPSVVDTDAARKLNDAQHDLSDTKCLLSDTQSQLSDSQSQLSDTRSQLSDSQTQLGGTQSQLDDNRSQLSVVKSQLSDTRCELSDTKCDLSDARSQISIDQSRLSDTRIQMNGAECELSDTICKLDDARGQLNDAQGQLNDAQGQLDDAQRRLSDTQCQLVELTDRLSSGESERLSSADELLRLSAENSELMETNSRLFAESDGSRELAVENQRLRDRLAEETEVKSEVEESERLSSTNELLRLSAENSRLFAESDGSRELAAENQRLRDRLAEETEVKSQVEESERLSSADDLLRLSAENSELMETNSRLVTESYGSREMAAENQRLRDRLAEETEVKSKVEESERLSSADDLLRLSVENSELMETNSRLVTESDGSREMAAENQRLRDRLAEETDVKSEVEESERLSSADELLRLSAENSRLVAESDGSRELAAENQRLRDRLAEETEVKTEVEESERLSSADELLRLSAENSRLVAENDGSRELASENQRLRDRLAEETEVKTEVEESERLSSADELLRLSAENSRLVAESDGSRELAAENQRLRDRLAEETEVEDSVACCTTAQQTDEISGPEPAALSEDGTTVELEDDTSDALLKVKSEEDARADLRREVEAERQLLSMENDLLKVKLEEVEGRLRRYEAPGATRPDAESLQRELVAMEGRLDDASEENRRLAVKLGEARDDAEGREDGGTMRERYDASLQECAALKEGEKEAEGRLEAAAATKRRELELSEEKVAFLAKELSAGRDEAQRRETALAEALSGAKWAELERDDWRGRCAEAEEKGRRAAAGADASGERVEEAMEELRREHDGALEEEQREARRAVEEAGEAARRWQRERDALAGQTDALRAALERTTVSVTAEEAGTQTEEEWSRRHSLVSEGESAVGESEAEIQLNASFCAEEVAGAGAGAGAGAMTDAPGVADEAAVTQDSASGAFVGVTISGDGITMTAESQRGVKKSSAMRRRPAGVRAGAATPAARGRTGKGSTARGGGGGGGGASSPDVRAAGERGGVAGGRVSPSCQALERNNERLQREKRALEVELGRVRRVATAAGQRASPMGAPGAGRAELGRRLAAAETRCREQTAENRRLVALMIDRDVDPGTAAVVDPGAAAAANGAASPGDWQLQCEILAAEKRQLCERLDGGGGGAGGEHQVALLARSPDEDGGTALQNRILLEEKRELCARLDAAARSCDAVAARMADQRKSTEAMEAEVAETRLQLAGRQKFVAKLEGDIRALKTSNAELAERLEESRFAYNEFVSGLNGR